jgi:hypothetical protein
MILQKARYHKNFFSGPVGVWSDFYCFLRLGKLQGERLASFLAQVENTCANRELSIFFY